MKKLVLTVTFLFSFFLMSWADPVGGDPLAGFDLNFDIPEETEDSRWQTGGYLEYVGRYGTDRGDFLKNRGKLFAEAGYKGDFFNFYGSASAMYDNAAKDWDGTEKDAEPYEVYVGYDGVRWNLDAGLKMLRWGVSDGINPLDLINPRDHLNPVAGARSDSRLPVWLGAVTYTGDAFTFEGVIIPVAGVNELPEEGSPWEPAYLREMRGSHRIKDEDKPESPEAAARIYTTVQGWDLALLYFSGYADDAVFTEKSGVLVPEYERLEAYGFNFAKGLSRSTIRGELAVKRSDIYEYDYIIGVFGFDRNFDDEEYLNIQLFADNASDSSQGATYEMYDKYLRGDLQAGFRGMHYFNDDSGTFEIYSEYTYGDNITLKAGGMAVYGTPNSAYGQFRRNDYLYTEVKFSF